MTPKRTPTTIYVIAAFDMHHAKSLLYRKCSGMSTLQRLLDQAIAQSATVISIRVVHPLPVPRYAPHAPTKPPSPLQHHQGHPP